ncbi:hypothetical protein LA664_00595 [Lactobacillus amylolyticus]|nr:lanthionine synthetase LanC family protein [Lactobacillus amylolyticus]KRL17171.1 hypothetical protein FD39_GL001253 [Lactobacillus amylolyticus DSM 11664]QFY03899.1 hypothetical protein LA664_00595 [Lactobacillus amylolyticus]TDG61444.1 hypothetical protein C5L18_000266 [Lactobacillus amylolyticus]
MNLYSGEQVIIKEARLGSTPTTTNCRYRLWDLKKNEFNLLNNRYFQKNINLPKPEDIFHYKDSFFIIEKKINGITLRKFISQNPLLVTKKYKGNFSNYNRHLKNIIENILLLIFSIHQAGYIMNDISDDNFLIDLTTDKVSVIDIESISKMEENKYRDVETARYILRKPENLTDINADYYKLSLLFLYLIFGKINEFLVDEHFFEKRFQLLKDKMSTIQKDVVNFSLWLYKKSKNNFVDLNTEKIIINKFKFRKFDEEALDNRNLSTSEILTQIKKYYIHKFNLKFDDKFKGTNYLGDLTKYTLTYGILGSMILGKKLAWISEVNLKELIQKVHIEINKNVEKNQLNNGLFFGLAGAALFDYYMDIPFEDNVYLFKLINRINSETNTSFANGLAGIIYALQEMSKNKGYPDFKEIIDSISLSHKEPNNNDEGFEYGDIGWAYILLREYKVSSKTFYLNVASKILKRSTSKYLNEKPFMGISYNSKLWPNIRCPYFMYGSAGLIYVLSLFYNMTGQFNWKIMEKYLTSLNQPYAYNYGFNNGAAGILYVLIKIKEQKDIPGNISQKINSMILNYKRMLLFHYQNKNEVLGWPTDGQIDFADDIGSGTLGIYLVLRKLI